MTIHTDKRRKGKPSHKSQGHPQAVKASRNRGSKPTSLETERVSFPERLKRLLDEIDAHLENKTRFNASIPPHRELTEALHWLVYMSGNPDKLHIDYNDGSRGEQFPVRVIWKPEGGWDWEPRPKLHLHVGTLSFRHVIYDEYVDLYLIRDKETRRLLQTDIESLAFERMSELLNAPQLQEESYISIYQAGLEPLAVGVYRALTEHLIERNKKGFGPLRVRPIYFIGDEEEEMRRPDYGTVWGTGEFV